MSKTNVVVTLQVEGLHHWPDAQTYQPDVAFLKYPHRHIFHITAKKRVSHDDRDIEIILMKRDMLDYFKRVYGGTDAQFVNFGPRSCEMIAKDLMEAYDLDYCQVLEDNENGAEIWK